MRTCTYTYNHHEFCGFWHCGLLHATRWYYCSRTWAVKLINVAQRVLGYIQRRPDFSRFLLIKVKLKRPTRFCPQRHTYQSMFILTVIYMMLLYFNTRSAFTIWRPNKRTYGIGTHKTWVYPWRGSNCMVLEVKWVRREFKNV